MSSQPKFVPAPAEAEDIHRIFSTAFRDTQFFRKRDGLPESLDACFMAGVEATELAGYCFGGPDKIMVDAAWFERLLLLCSSPHVVLGDRLQHLLTMRSALGEYREHIKVMGKNYFLPSEIVALLRREGVA